MAVVALTPEFEIYVMGCFMNSNLYAKVITGCSEKGNG